MQTPPLHQEEKQHKKASRLSEQTSITAARKNKENNAPYARSRNFNLRYGDILKFGKLINNFRSIYAGLYPFLPILAGTQHNKACSRLDFAPPATQETPGLMRYQNWNRRFVQDRSRHPPHKEFAETGMPISSHDEQIRRECSRQR